VDVSPFPYQGPLEPDQLTGRAELIADLTERVTEHRVTALLGPRRYGKTSALRRVAADVIAAGVAVAWVDLYEVASIADLAARFDAALARVPGRFAELATRFAAAAEINLGVVSLELRAPGRARPDPLLTLHSLLDVLVRSAAATPTLLVCDEFSGITRVDGASAMLRTHLQHHFQELGIVFAGSEPSMMRMLFGDQAQPFYAQADLVEIPPLSDAEVVELVQSGFRATERRPGPLAGQVAAFVDGHPQRAMQCADAAWRHVDRGGAATDATWSAALDDVRAATALGHERLYSALQAGERTVLRALASGGSIFGTAADVLDLSIGAAQHARRQLVDRGHLVERDGRYVIVDPVFADWINHRFPF